MTNPDSAPLTIALQEWAACCERLLSGEQILIVRKGGIHERGGGLFSLEHERFLLLPTYLHQDATRLRPGIPIPTDAAPGILRIAGWAEATHIWKVTDFARLLALGDELVWTPDELASRFRYRDQPWLYVIALRVHRLATVNEQADLPRYAGCRSWIPLATAVSTTDSAPVLTDAESGRRMAAVASLLGTG